jgi:hypothetical protein
MVANRAHPGETAQQWHGDFWALNDPEPVRQRLGRALWKATWRTRGRTGVLLEAERWRGERHSEATVRPLQCATVAI